VAGANGGADCLEKLNNEKFDMLLLDLMMPKMDGWELLKKIRNDERLKALPVFIFTARYSIEEISDKAIDMVSDYIAKTDASKMLVKKIESFLSETAPSKEKINYLMKMDEKIGKDHEEAVNARAMYKGLHSTLIRIINAREGDSHSLLLYFKNALRRIEENTERCENKIKELEKAAAKM